MLYWFLEGSPRVQVELKEAWGGAEEHKATDPRLGWSGFKSQPCHLPAVGLWTSYSTSLFLSFLIIPYKMGVLIVVTSLGCGEDAVK